MEPELEPRLLYSARTDRSQTTNTADLRAYLNQPVNESDCAAQPDAYHLHISTEHPDQP